MLKWAEGTFSFWRRRPPLPADISVRALPVAALTQLVLGADWLPEPHCSHQPLFWSCLGQTAAATASLSDAGSCQDGCITCLSPVEPRCILGCFLFLFTPSEACTWSILKLETADWTYQSSLQKTKQVMNILNFFFKGINVSLPIYTLLLLHFCSLYVYIFNCKHFLGDACEILSRLFVTILLSVSKCHQSFLDFLSLICSHLFNSDSSSASDLISSLAGGACMVEATVSMSVLRPRSQRGNPLPQRMLRDAHKFNTFFYCYFFPLILNLFTIRNCCNHFAYSHEV